MAFRGFEDHSKVDELLSGGQYEDEDLAVYDWNDPTGYGYDTHGGSLEEDRDDLNDETFGEGGGGGTGKDFNFGGHSSAAPSKLSKSSSRTPSKAEPKSAPAPSHPQTTPSKVYSSKPLKQQRDASLEALWNDNSVSSVLGGIVPRSSPGAAAGPSTSGPRYSSHNAPVQQSPTPPRPSAMSSSTTLPSVTANPSQPRIRTLEEIEAEMLASQTLSRPLPVPPGPNTGQAISQSQSLPMLGSQSTSFLPECLLAGPQSGQGYPQPPLEHYPRQPPDQSGPPLGQGFPQTLLEHYPRAPPGQGGPSSGRGYPQPPPEHYPRPASDQSSIRRSAYASDLPFPNELRPVGLSDGGTSYLPENRRLPPDPYPPQSYSQDMEIPFLSDFMSPPGALPPLGDMPFSQDRRGPTMQAQHELPPPHAYHQQQQQYEPSSALNFHHQQHRYQGSGSYSMEELERQMHYAQLSQQLPQQPPRMMPMQPPPPEFTLQDLEHQKREYLLQQRTAADRIVREEAEQQIKQAMAAQRPIPVIDSDIREQPTSLLKELQRHTSPLGSIPAAGLEGTSDGTVINPHPSSQAILHPPIAHAVPSDYDGIGPPDFLSNLSTDERKAVMHSAMSKIMEAEVAEGKRRRKANKLSRMAPRNELMTQGDKDFITRIQVSQLVTADPYEDDFYAQVFGAIVRARMGQPQAAGMEAVIKFGAGGGVGLGIGRGAGRRQNAMERMRQQVEKLVMNARAREKERGLEQALNLQGTLGKLVPRGSKAAPRPLLQVKSESFATSPPLTPSAVSDGARVDASVAASDGFERRVPLTQRQILTRIETAYNIILKLEHARREQPPPEDGLEDKIHQWTEQYDALSKQLWDELLVMDPLDVSDPHPFISLLRPSKGKKLLPRSLRHLSSKESLTVVTLLIACFTQLDVIRGAELLDKPEDTTEKREMEKQTELFLTTVMPSLVGALRKSGLRLVSGLLGHLISRCNVVEVGRTRPGLELLTMFLAQAEGLKHGQGPEAPAQDELDCWQSTYDHLFASLSGFLSIFFPSTRRHAFLPFGPAQYIRPTAADDIADQPTWQFLATLGVSASMQQQQFLVQELRDKVLENVLSQQNGSAADEEEIKIKIGNVNLFLNALGLDSSQIQV